MPVQPLMSWVALGRALGLFLILNLITLKILLSFNSSLFCSEPVPC